MSSSQSNVQSSSGSDGSSSTASDGVTLVVDGPSVDVWGAVETLHRCGSYIASVPDIPARAYVDNTGTTHMIVGSTAYVAPHQCRSSGVVH